MAFSHILVPTDFSEPAFYALRYGLDEALLHHAKLTLLHVLPPHTGIAVYSVTGTPEPQPGFDPVLSQSMGSLPPPQPMVVREDPYEVTLAQLRDLMADASDVTWEAEVATGPAAETIVQIAQERAADLIVMGTHGRTGLRHLLVGSVAEKVVRLATCPVLTVR
jgi:nucleotide-binding universal stress UspA family protein